MENCYNKPKNSSLELQNCEVTEHARCAVPHHGVHSNSTANTLRAGQSRPSTSVFPLPMPDSQPLQPPNPYPLQHVHHTSNIAPGQDPSSQNRFNQDGVEHPPGSLPCWQIYDHLYVHSDNPSFATRADSTLQMLPVQGPSYGIRTVMFAPNVFWIQPQYIAFVPPVLKAVSLPYVHDENLRGSVNQGAGYRSHPGTSNYVASLCNSDSWEADCPQRRQTVAQTQSSGVCSSQPKRLRQRDTAQQAALSRLALVPPSDRNTGCPVTSTAGQEQSMTDHYDDQSLDSEASPHINLVNLPDLVLLKVMSYLPIPDLVLGVGPTCTRLNALSCDPSLWTSVNVTYFNTFLTNPSFSSRLLMQDCYIAGREDWGQPQDEEDKAKPEKAEVQTKRVKDYIRTLTVEQQSVDSSAHPYFYNMKRRRYRKQGNNLIFYNSRFRCHSEDGHIVFSSDTPVCPRLAAMNVRSITLTPSLIPVLHKHPWLTELSVTILPGCPGYIFKVLERLVESYTAFQTLTRLKKFTFVFPSSRWFQINYQWGLFSNSRCLNVEMKKFFEAVTTLEDVEVTDNPDSILSTILRSCRGLRSLAISSPELTVGDFQCQTPLSSLKALTVRSADSILTAALAREMATAFPNLRAVDFPDMQGTDEGLAVLLRRCRYLEAVHLDCDTGQGVPPGSDASVLYKSSALLRLCASNRTPLRELSIRTEVNDEFLRQLCAQNSTLTSLSLTVCEDITDASLDSLADLCPRLTHLRLVQKLSHLSAKSILRFARKCRLLTSLEMLSENNKGRFVPLTDRAEDVCGLCSRPEEKQKHEGAWTDRFSETGRWVNECSTRHLQAARLPRCDHSRVQKIKLGQIPQMTAEDMLVLVRACPSLLELHLLGCHSLDDWAVEVIVRGCPSLRSLTLDRQKHSTRHRRRPCHVTSTTLALLAEHATCLQHFQALYCTKFCPQHLAHLLVHSRSLKTVAVTCGDRFHRLQGFDATDGHVKQQLSKCHPPRTLHVNVKDTLLHGKLGTRLMTMNVVKQ
ncbi:hypothetical protein ACOMHN_037508 [Nucella lapillus]